MTLSQYESDNFKVSRVSDDLIQNLTTNCKICASITSYIKEISLKAILLICLSDANIKVFPFWIVFSRGKYIWAERC